MAEDLLTDSKELQAPATESDDKEVAGVSPEQVYLYLKDPTIQKP